MKTKRYFKLLLKPYNIILKNFDEDIRISIGTKFCCFPQLEEKEIEIPIFEDKKGRKAFYEKMQRRLKEYGIDGNFSSEILSFLHEIGHIYTYSRFNEIKYNLGNILIQELQAKFPNPKYLNFFFNWYFNLKLEKNADKWAMNYIKEHQEQVEQWQEMLQENYNKIIPKFINHMKIKYNKDLLTE